VVVARAPSHAGAECHLFVAAACSSAHALARGAAQPAPADRRERRPPRAAPAQTQFLRALWRRINVQGRLPLKTFANEVLHSFSYDFPQQLAQRIFDVFDADNNESVDESEFVVGMTVLSKAGTAQEKAQCP
jgi:hypothetical protein